ncbi:YdhK family protein [Heyndrickxia ginsengihumi]|uniref:YdhK family protein n=1 Tax=Heyndrickxia ginsengihumi TaxID=363870 RepID=UPI000471E092|nr:YdhK family protein [Heyndrickxia ginsengihumi]
MNKKMIAGLILLLFVFALTACGSHNASKANGSIDAKSDSTMNMENMEHSGSGEVPARLKEEKNPTYQVGSKVTLKAGHMEGMIGAKATIKGAYATTAYIVNYRPTTGGAKVKNHRWVTEDEVSPRM